MSTHLCIAGTILLVLALAHAYFPRHFGWRAELAPVSLLTRQVFFVHHLFIAVTVGLMGLMTLVSRHELIGTPLGRRIMLGCGIFWGIRLFCQLFVFSPDLWRGKRFESGVHYLFCALWSYLTAVYLAGMGMG